MRCRLLTKRHLRHRSSRWPAWISNFGPAKWILNLFKSQILSSSLAVKKRSISVRSTLDYHTINNVNSVIQLAYGCSVTAWRLHVDSCAAILVRRLPFWARTSGRPDSGLTAGWARKFLRSASTLVGFHNKHCKKNIVMRLPSRLDGHRATFSSEPAITTVRAHNRAYWIGATY